jgi:ABC-type transport system involved in multi-copper enzyme maturation permease subunit
MSSIATSAPITMRSPMLGVMPGVVALNTFREAVRDRILYNLIFFALVMMGAAILVGQISIGIERLVIVNLGLSAISIFGLIMAIFIGVSLVSKEIEKRTLYSLLAKPIRRWEFLVGRYAGLLLTLVVNTSLMTVGLAGALFYVSHRFQLGDTSILIAVYFILLQLALVTALALFFSCFSTPVLSTLYTLGIYIAGIFANDIRGFEQFTKSPAMDVVARVIYYVLPNFHNFNVIASASHGDAIPLTLVWQNTLYVALYVTVVLIASASVFSRRNLK